MSQEMIGLWVQGKLIRVFRSRKAALAFVGRRHISGYIDSLSEEDIIKLVGKHGIRSKSS